jgi:ribosome-binding factor A
MKHKCEQVAASIQKAVQQVIAKGLQDPRISGLITVTDVRVTVDMTQAHIAVSVFPEDREELTIHGLEAAKNFIRREVGEIVRTRQLPAFSFRIDKSLKKQAAVLLDINRAMEEIASKPSEAAHSESDEPTGSPDQKEAQ